MKKKTEPKKLKVYNVTLAQKAITYLETTLEFEAISKKEAIKMAKAQRDAFDDKCWDNDDFYELTGEETYNIKG